jgi:hypothetical protein
LALTAAQRAVVIDPLASFWLLPPSGITIAIAALWAILYRPDIARGPSHRYRSLKAGRAGRAPSRLHLIINPTAYEVCDLLRLIQITASSSGIARMKLSGQL